MNAFKDEYQKAVVENAKHFAKCLAAEGLDVAGDPAMDYTDVYKRQAQKRPTRSSSRTQT